jgi:hypothetical protein
MNTSEQNEILDMDSTCTLDEALRLASLIRVEMHQENEEVLDINGALA